MTAVLVSGFCVVLEIVVLVQCQPYPLLVHNGIVLSNNSFISRDLIGVGDDALMCVTGNTTECCASAGNWTDGKGGAVHQGTPGESEEIVIYVTREARVVSLNGNTRGGRPGMWRCDIPDSSGVMQSIYIYIGTTGPSGRGESVECVWLSKFLYFCLSGQLTSASIYFTALHTEPSISPPEFTLTCQSVGGPATTVSWQRNGTTVEEDSDHETSQIIVDTTANSVYENRLQVRGREGGTYQCTVRNNRNRASFRMTTSTVDGRLLQFKCITKELAHMHPSSCWGAYQLSCCPAVSHKY